MQFYKFSYNQWKKDNAKLRKERKSFRDNFDKHRTCRCKILSCRHLKSTEKELEFKHKAWELHIKYMNNMINNLMLVHPEWFENGK